MRKWKKLEIKELLEVRGTGRPEDFNGFVTPVGNGYTQIVTSLTEHSNNAEPLINQIGNHMGFGMVQAGFYNP